MGHFTHYIVAGLVAYIDPGTGSMILQLLLGGIAGVWIILKLFGRRIKSFLGLSGKDKDQSAE